MKKKAVKIFRQVFIGSILLIITGCTGLDRKSESKQSGEVKFGILGNFWVQLNDPERQEKMIELAFGINPDMYKEGILMDWIMPAAETYDESVLGRYESLFETLLSEDAVIVGGVDWENSWYTEDYYAPYEKEHFETYADFVYYLADKYKNIIQYWEIGNEPEVSEFWKPEPNAYNYTQMLKHAYIRAKEGDPRCTVIGFSGISSQLNYIEKVFDNGGLEYMDMLGIHPFCYSDPDCKSIFEISHELSVIKELRGMMRDRGNEIPIIITEVGYPTNIGEFGVSEQRQAEMLVRSFVLLFAEGINQVFWATLKDESPDKMKMDGNFGIINYDLTPKKAYYAYRILAQTLSESYFVSEIYSADKCKAVQFRNRRGTDTVLIWSYDETPNEENGDVVCVEKTAEIRFEGVISNVFDIYGKEYEHEKNTSVIRLDVTGSPVYLKGNFGITRMDIH